MEEVDDEGQEVEVEEQQRAAAARLNRNSGQKGG
jgi:hypothetical protein